MRETAATALQVNRCQRWTVKLKQHKLFLQSYYVTVMRGMFRQSECKCNGKCFWQRSCSTESGQGQDSQRVRLYWTSNTVEQLILFRTLLEWRMKTQTQLSTQCFNQGCDQCGNNNAFLKKKKSGLITCIQSVCGVCAAIGFVTHPFKCVYVLY